jgi:aromatic ring-opening dioxygenase catalytic subunit (LigB family)
MTNITEGTSKIPTFFLSHGGGPWPYMKAENPPGLYDNLESSLKKLPEQIGQKPKALLVISGHWEEDEFTLQGSSAPGMIYDYYGFPPHTYAIKYPAPGDPALARRIQDLLGESGIRAKIDPNRGFDHGLYSVLAVSHPNANTPVIQLSLKTGFDPEEHLALGRALAPLRSEGIAIIGSGLSYHNLHRFGWTGASAAAEFDQWLALAMRENPQTRSNSLANWSHAPSARLAHPREDHLIPLLVAVGAAESEPASLVYHETFMGLEVSSYALGLHPAE